MNAFRMIPRIESGERMARIYDFRADDPNALLKKLRDHAGPEKAPRSREDMRREDDAVIRRWRERQWAEAKGIPFDGR